MRRNRGLFTLVGLLVLAAIACGISDSGSSGPGRNAVQIEVMANSGVGEWLGYVVNEFNSQELENGDGDPVWVNLSVVEAGNAVTQLENGAMPTVWIPDDKVWANVVASLNGNSSYQTNCTAIAQSPLVIAMWQPIAEGLGYPGRELGWLDIGSLAADQSAWQYYSGGFYGDTLRLGHTHPGLSGSGASTLLALVQAAQSKTDAVSVDEIQQPIVQASVGAFEGAVSWFSSDTADLQATMTERGSSFLGAAVMYESNVIAHNLADPNNPIIPIYPFEGTFVATHPACIQSDASAASQEAATIFLDFVTSEAMQLEAVNRYGLRPVTNVDTSGSLDGSFGVDFAQPTTVFNAPTVDTIFAVQDVWQAARKDVNLVMLLDVSGSMSGNKIAGMREAAVQFVGQMGDDDFLTVLTFSHELNLVVNHERVGDNRDKIQNTIQNLIANGDTALYDAIGTGAEIIAQTGSSQTTNALVVLTDGLDTYSFRFRYDQSLVNAASANDTTVFTIAYGSDADEKLLRDLAESAFGNYYQGSEADIAGIYEEMSAAFGGNLGVGR